MDPAENWKHLLHGRCVDKNLANVFSRAHVTSSTFSTVCSALLPKTGDSESLNGTSILASCHA